MKPTYKKLKQQEKMDWDKKKMLDEMGKQYSDEQLFGYPKFAKNKLPYGDPKDKKGNGISIYENIPEFKTREQVLQWIDKNMSEEQLSYTGF